MSEQCSISNNPLLKGLEKKAQLAVNYIDEEYKYMQSLKRYRDNYAILMTERREGFAEGYAEGFAERYAKDFSEGERRATINLAHKMIDNGIPLKDVLNLTGLCEEDLL